MSTDDDEENKIAAFEAKLRSEDGVSVRYQKNTANSKKGSLQLDGANGPSPVFILKRVTSKGYSKETQIRWKDVAGVFGSTCKDAPEAIVLIGATRHARNRHVGIDSWRFTVSENDAPSRDKIMAFLRSKGEVANGVLTNIFPTHGSNMTGETIGFSEGVHEGVEEEEGLGGALKKHIPEIIGVCDQMFKLGEKAAIVAPVFTLFAAIVANYETVQGLKGDFIALLAGWSKIEGNLVGEVELKMDLLALAEDFFFKPGWLRRLASKDFQSNLTRLAERMKVAVLRRVLDNTEMSKDDQKLVLENFEVTIETMKNIDRNVRTLLRQLQQVSLVHEKQFDWNNVQSILPQKRKLMGRQDELKSIEDALEVRGAIVTLSGVGGCGKSHLGIEAALRWTERKSLRVAFFLSTENEITCRSSLLKVMKKLGLDHVLQVDGKPIPTDELVRRIYKRLEEAPPTFQVLWLLDNVPVAGGIHVLSGWFGPEEDRDWSKCCAVLTSQSFVYCGETAFGDIEMIPVDPLPTNVSVDLLMKNFPKLQAQEDERLAAVELVEKFLHNLPVAILAVSGMINRPWTFRGYLKKLEEKKVTAGVDSVAKALQDALSHARSNVGMARILDVAAFVSPDDMPLSLLKDEDSVGRLCELNLVQVVSDQRYSMHRLIQDAARVDRSAARAIGALENAIESYDDDDPATWAAGVSMLTHVEALRKISDVECVVSDMEPQVMLVYGRLMTKCGFVYSTVLCDFLKSRQLHEDVLKVRRALYLDAHLDIARTLHNLGAVYQSLGEYEQAKEYYEKALLIYRAVYGETAVHSDIALTLNNLGEAYRESRDYAQANEYYNHAVAIYREVYGETTNHRHIASALNNLGIVYNDVGEYEQAKIFLSQALAMYRAVDRETPNHLGIASILNNLGAVHKELHDYGQAQDFYNQALAMYRVVFGEKTNHSDTAIALVNLGDLHQKRGNYTQSMVYCEEALAMFRTIHGKSTNHPHVAATLFVLGTVYESMREIATANGHYQQALDMYRVLSNGNDQHPDIQKTIRRQEALAAKECVCACVLL